MNTLSSIKTHLDALAVAYKEMPSYMPGVDKLGEALELIQESIELNEDFDPADYAQAEYDRQKEEWMEGERI